MDYISKLINRYLAGRYSPETEAKIQQWLVDEVHVDAKDKALQDYFSSINTHADKETYQALTKLRKRLGMNIPVKTLFPARKLLLRAAAILLPLLMLAGAYWYINRPIPIIDQVIAYGEQKQITLPDGSQVWLNAGSRLTYPERFTKTRTLHLIGEAYFSVVKDPGKPFVVETKHLSIEALGTEFNVTAYPDDEKTTTALASGKVQVIIEDGKSYLLSPNQQLSLDNQTREHVVTKVLAEDIAARKNGGLIFDNATLMEILRTLERKFNNIIKIEEAELPSDRYSVKFVNGETFEQVMSVLKDMAGDFKWQIDKNHDNTEQLNQ